jgi:hypothetical protein
MFTILAISLLSACSGETGQPAVAFEAVAVAAGEKTFTIGDISISLDEANVAFGPAYFCASASGSATLCETAAGEIRDVATIDLLQKEQQPLGAYEGLAGTVRSASFDYGIHWFLPESEAHPDAKAKGGHSAILRGTASRAGASVPFEAEVDVLPQYQGQRAVPSTPAEGEISTATTGLEVHLDVASWLADVEFAEAIEAGDEPFLIRSGAPDYNAIVIRMVSSSVPTFVFK